MFGSIRFSLVMVIGFISSIKAAPFCPGTLTPNAQGVCTSTCLAGTYSTTGGPCVKASQFYYVPLAGATSQIPCAAGTTSLTTGASSCTRCPPTLYSKTGGGCFYCPNGQTTVDHITCNKCPPGSYSMFGETCQVSPAGTYILANGFTYAFCPVGTTSVKGVQLLSSCTPCPAGTGNTVAGAPCVVIPYYNILVTDETGGNVQGYLSRSEDQSTGVYTLTSTQSSAQVIYAPNLISSTSSPQNLVVVFPGSAGNNLDLSYGYAGIHSGTFDSTSNAYVWLSAGTQSDAIHSFDQTTDNAGNKGESKVWIVSSADANGSRQLSVSFLDSSSQPVTCAKFFFYPHAITYVGASCTSGIFSSSTSNLYLIPALAGSY